MSAPRLDWAIQHGLEVLAQGISQRLKLGDVSSVTNPVIKRFVDENVRTHRIPVTAEEIAEEMGLLRKQKKEIR